MANPDPIDEAVLEQLRRTNMPQGSTYYPAPQRPMPPAAAPLPQRGGGFQSGLGQGWRPPVLRGDPPGIPPEPREELAMIGDVRLAQERANAMAAWLDQLNDLTGTPTRVAALRR